MIDVKLILEKPEYVKEALAKKLWDFDPKPVIELSAKRLDLLKSVEANKAEQNRLSASVPASTNLPWRIISVSRPSGPTARISPSSE